MSESLCELLARRRKILNSRIAPIRLEIQNPYINIDGTQKTDASGNLITSYRISERRKAEILQYNKTSSVQAKLTSANKFKQTIESVGRMSNKVVENADGSSTTYNVSRCTSDLYLPTSSSAAGIPGPSFNIQYRPEVPLYKYATNVQQFGTPDVDSLKAWSFNAGTNIQSLNNEWTTLVKISHNIDNIDSEQINREYLFNMDIPIGLYVSGDISGEYIIDNSSNHTFISNIDVRVIDHRGGIVTIPTVTNHFNDISLNYVIRNSNNFTALRYIGNMPLNVILNIENLSYYEIQIKFDIKKQDNNNYLTLMGIPSYVSSVFMNLTDNNLHSSNNVHTTELVNSGSTNIIPFHRDFTIIGIAQG